MTRSQLLWLPISLLLLAACITLGIMLGWGATGVIFAAAVLPDISLIGAFATEGKLKPQRVRLYNFLHAVTLPSGLALIGCVVAASTQDFTALLFALAWFTHIAVDRACGYRLREPDGSIRPERIKKVVAP